MSDFAFEALLWLGMLSLTVFAGTIIAQALRII
jgi:hypothetical protein